MFTLTKSLLSGREVKIGPERQSNVTGFSRYALNGLKLDKSCTLKFFEYLLSLGQ